MNKYSYIAVDINKDKYKGTFLAEDEESLRKMLADQDLFLVRSKKLSNDAPNPFFSVSGKVSTKELTSFCRQFAVMISAGISIIESMEVLKNQSFSGFFKKSLDVIYEDIQAGLLLSEAMKKHKRVFPEFFSNMVSVGEISGALDEVLENLADYYEREQHTKSKTQEALLYPIILIVMIIAVLAIMFVFVIPKFKSALLGLGVELPAITLFILNLSAWFVENWKYLFIAIVALITIMIGIGKSKKGRYIYDTILLYIPVVRKIIIALASSRFSRGMGLLLSSGMDTLRATDTMSRLLSNKNIERRMQNAVTDIANGSSMTDALKKQKLFPDVLTQMVAVGERSGTLDSVLLSSCRYFDAEVDNTLNTFMTLLQPILLMIIGGIVLFVFLAVYSPILAMIEIIK